MLLGSVGVGSKVKARRAKLKMLKKFGPERQTPFKSNNQGQNLPNFF